MEKTLLYKCNKIPENRNHDPLLLEELNKLKHLIKGNSSLNDFIEFFDDFVLLGFVKGKKNDAEKAYSTLVNYIGLRRKKYRHFFKELLPSTNITFSLEILRFLKHRDQLNRAVVINHLWKWDPNIASVDDTHRMLMLILEQYLDLTYSFGIDGFVIVVDVKDTTFDQVKAGTPSKMYQLIDLLWKNFPIRFSEMHIVNGNFFANSFLKGVRPFLPRKVRERLFVHSDMASLHLHVQPMILPESLGGCLAEEDAFCLEVEQNIRSKEEYYSRFSGKL